MTRVGSWPVRTAAVGQVSVGSALWRLEGQLMVTTVVKVTLGLKPDAPMTVIAPAPLCAADEHDGGHPMSSLRAARETAPQLQRVDVLLTGYAYPTRGAAEVDVSLAILGRGQTLLSKALRVRGDRGPNGLPRPFERMKLGYERSYGGIGYLDNPLGTGFGSTDAAPNIVYPDDEARPAGFGPIPAFFPSRKRLLGDVAKRALTKRIAEIPLDFDWSYFQAAPEDQRINLLRGDEWIELEGVVRGAAVLRSQLPRAVGVAKVYGAERAKVPPLVPLMADMLHIDAEAQSASLIWRGSFPVSNEEALGTITIAGGVELPDEPMLWPETEADLVDITSFVEGPTEQLRAIREVDVSTTTVMTPSEREGGTTSFDSTVVVDAASAASEALPFTAEAAPNEARRRAQQQGGRALPFAATPEGAEHPLAGTRSLSDEDIAAESAPFDIAPAGGKSPDSSGRHIPGAPWAEDSSVPAPMPIDRNLKGTVTAMHVDALTAKREAEAKAKREAEAKKRDAEAKAKRDAEQEAKQRAQAEAEARREAEAQRFREEQERAKADEAKREAEAAKKKAEAAKQLRNDIYGGFKRKR